MSEPMVRLVIDGNSFTAPVRELLDEEAYTAQDREAVIEAVRRMWSIPEGKDLVVSFSRETGNVLVSPRAVFGGVKWA